MRHTLLALLLDLQTPHDHIQLGRDQWFSAIDTMTRPVFIFDREFRVVRANRNYAKYAGMDVREVIDKPYWQVFPRVDGPLENFHRDIGEYGEVVEELSLTTGQIFRDHSYTVSDDEGCLFYSIHVLEDITECKRVGQTLQRLNQTLHTLRQINQALLHSTDEDSLIKIACQILTESGDYAFAWFGYAEHDSQKHIRPVASSVKNAGYLDEVTITWNDDELGRGAPGTAIRTTAPMVVNDIAAHPDYTPWREQTDKYGFRSSIALPLVDNNGCFGALNIYSARSNAFDEEAQHLLMEMANNLAFGITGFRRRSKAADRENQMRNLIEHNPDAILMLNAEGNIEFANPSAEALLGQTAMQLQGMPFGLPATMGERTRIKVLFGNDDKVKDLRSAELRLVNIGSADGPKLVAFLHDITEREKAEKFTARMGRILEHSWNEIYIFSADTLRFLDVSTGARQHLGYSLDELRQMTIMDIHPHFNREQLELLFKPLHTGQEQEIYFETEQRRKDDTFYPVEVSLQLSSKEYPPVFIAIVQDISERKRYIAELERRALYDTLTGLPNRTLLHDRLDQALKIAHRKTAPLAVFSISVLHFNEINDFMGYQNGDQILKEIANRLREVCRKSDSLARLSDDEFIILLDQATLEPAKTVARRIQKIFETPVNIADFSLEIEVTVGIAIYPDHGEDSHTLLQRGNIAMRLAKNDGMGILVYKHKLNPFSLRRLRLHGELRRAIENGELSLFYQPKVDLKTSRIMGAEALARWLHPDEGMIPPVEFIPMIEQSGLIQPFTNWALEEATKLLRQWMDDGINLSIAVNLSTRNLLDPDLPGTVTTLLDTHQLGTHALCLEITESALMSRPEKALKVLNQLHEIGIKLSIDDFGTGHSSLAYLKKLPVNELKIDQSFVFGLTKNENDAIIIRSTIQLAHNMGLKTVAEGVEDKATMEMLKILNCDIAQGYYMSQPLPETKLKQWLYNSRWGIACPI